MKRGIAVLVVLAILASMLGMPASAAPRERSYPIAADGASPNGSTSQVGSVSALSPKTIPAPAAPSLSPWLLKLSAGQGAASAARVDSGSSVSPVTLTAHNCGGTAGGSTGAQVHCVFLPAVMRGLSCSGAPPSTPTLDPIDNADGDGNYAVSWSMSAGATSYTLEENGVQVYSGPSTSWVASGKPAGTYSYRVNASNMCGTSAWSNVQSVTVSAPPPPPTLHPIDNADGDGNYTLSWSTSAGATSYTLEENGGQVYSGPNTSWVASGKPTGAYSYRVKASNAAGTSAWSNVQSVTVSGWQTLVNTDFESTFPAPWEVLDGNGDYAGVYTWAPRTCRAYEGSHSGWAVGGGANGSGLGCESNYPNYAESWMVYGPFSLADASAADLSFQLWLNSEYGYDFAVRAASLDGTTFYGTWTTGNSQGWLSRTLDLSDVPTLGNLLGAPEVWVALIFVSDSSITRTEGAYVDNIVLRKHVGASTNVVAEAAPTLPSEAREQPVTLVLDR